MLDDAPVQGRQTNRKLIIVLLLLASVSLFGSWALANWGPVSSSLREVKNQIFRKTSKWQSAACTPDTKAVTLGSGICFLTEGTATVLDAQGQVQYSMETDAERLCGSVSAAAYTPLGKTLNLLGDKKGETLAISGGIDTVILGRDSCVAVITAGSGYLTKTEIYDTSGQLLGEIGLSDAAMVAAAFLSEDQLLAGLCVLTDGSWELRYYGRDGVLRNTAALKDLAYQDVLSCGEGVLVETEEAVFFMNEAGDQTGSFTWDVGSLDALECSQEGYAVLILSEGCTYELYTVGMDGSLWGITQLSGPIRGLSVCGNTVCILDFEELEVYDRHCEPTKIFPEGARAATVAAEDGACWLLGDGELMHLRFT
jgi:hypothetical protein